MSSSKNRFDALRSMRPETGPKKARKSTGAKTKKPASRKTGITEEFTGKAVTVGIKAPDWLAHFWTVRAKMARKSLTGVIVRALVEEFGAPDTAEADEFLQRYLDGG